jgi:acyl carrier protein
MSTMTNFTSSRTPEGEPTRCPVCRNEIGIVPSPPSDDGPCPSCGTLLWFHVQRNGIDVYDMAVVLRVRDHFLEYLQRGRSGERHTTLTSFFASFGADSLDLVEFVMEVEEEIANEPDSEFGRLPISAILEYIQRRRL